MRIESDVTRPRFYVPGLDPSRGETMLPEDESHHLVRVMRLAAGDEIAVFDGTRPRVPRARGPGRSQGSDGRDRRCRSPSASRARRVHRPRAGRAQGRQDGRRRARRDDGGRRAHRAGRDRALAASAWPRSDARTPTSAGSASRSRPPSSAAARGCPHRAPQPFRDWLEAPFEGRRLLLVEPSSDAGDVQPMRAALAGAAPAAVACIVGPEGGWSAAERVAAVSAGCVLASLGQMTLRADAVGLVAVSIVNFTFDDR